MSQGEKARLQSLLADLTGVEREARQQLVKALLADDEDGVSAACLVLSRHAEARALILLMLSKLRDEAPPEVAVRSH
ncbi:MAG: hypothetical protein ABW250_00645 [Pyrinomonadaceae bacterium]